MINRTLAVAVTTLLLALAGYASAADAARSAEAILADLDAAKLPQLDQTKRSDQAYIREFIDAQRKVLQQQAGFALEMFQGYPDHARVPELMNRRWMVLLSFGDADKVIAETEPLTAGSSKLAVDACYARANATLRKDRNNTEAISKAVEAFEAKAPGDERGAILLSGLAGGMADAKQQVAVYQKILDKYPTSRVAAQAKGKMRQAQGVGKPFELSFKEAITGKAMDMKDLKGKVVVIDFWATWCGPCIAEMPKMKTLYAEYKPKGVEFIGVSLDQPEAAGGLQKLKDYVAENQIAWPQYYQGNYWQSEFSSSWGINSIPAVFIVDQNGNLYSNEARGKLEKMIPELLANVK